MQNPGNVWSGLFNAVKQKNTSVGNPTSLAERLHNAADQWKTETDALHTRLLERLKNNGRSNSTSQQNLSEFANIIGQLTKVPPLSQTNQSDSNNGSSLLDSLQARLSQVHVGSLDPHQLAVLTALQGVALSALVKHAKHASSSAHAGIMSSNGSLFRNENNFGKFSPFDAGPRKVPSSHLGILVPNSLESFFTPEICISLQNFGNNQGYRSVYMGRPPCGAQIGGSIPTAPTSQLSSAQLMWGTKAGFNLDCGFTTTAINATEQYSQSIVSSAINHIASELNAALHPLLSCQLSLASTSTPSVVGSGTLLEHSQSAPVLGQSKWNSLRIQICNITPKTPGSVGSVPMAGEVDIIDVETLKLNGHSVLSSNDHQVLQALSGQVCTVTLIRVPSAAFLDGFTLSGLVNLQAGSVPWGVGQMSSIGIEVGGLKIIH